MLLAGEKSGPYEVLALLGRGGMGEMYRGRDTRLGRNVAIKVILSDLAGPSEFRDRCGREAKAISTLNHPHLCALYDVGEHEGRAYVVMEYIEGETLAAVLEKGLLPLNEALRYSIEIADALAAAHGEGIVHGGLNPHNIMVTPAGVKVLDFGLAVLCAPGTPGSRMVGVQFYISPEWAMGGRVDARSDVFVFGLVLYEMLCGRRPFPGVTTLITSLATQKTWPDPPRKLRAEIPAAIEQIVLRCLERQPEARFASAGELHRALFRAASF